jgi:hypothetical protein
MSSTDEGVILATSCLMESSKMGAEYGMLMSGELPLVPLAKV